MRTEDKLLVLVGLLVALALVTGATASAGGDQVKRKDFAFIGDVVSVDEEASSLEVAPTTGFGYGGAAQVTVHVDGDTQFSPAGTALATLRPGDEIRTSGRLVDGRLVAEVLVLAP